MTISMQNNIEATLTEVFSPQHLEVENETHNHSVPTDAESHFKVTLVSAAFDGLMLLKQHRLVNAALASQLKQIHALALHTYTPAQWQERQQAAPDSPPCKGGSNVS